MRVVGVDIGGTFTDFMLYDTESGAVRVHRCRRRRGASGR
jgi:N-methylhydantoinase A/oxoprolinase/acetone carboxylase beta subunit